MVYLINGEVFPGHKPQKGSDYQREATKFRSKLTPIPSGRPASQRYHLIVSAACPWAHRTLLVRALKGLQKDLGVSTVLPVRDDAHGWAFAAEGQDTESDDKATGQGYKYLYQVYLLADPTYTGNITTPVLYDAKEQNIISNESSDILRMLNDWVQADKPHTPDLFPKHLHTDIETLCADMHQRLNNGVYRCGLAKSQEAYDQTVHGVFECLDALEERLQGQRYLLGQAMTLADVQLFPTLIRFDAVYFSLFKCAKRRLCSYHHLSHYLRDLYQSNAGVAETVDMPQIRLHYYTNFTSANPHGLVHVGIDDDAALSFNQPHDRARLNAIVDDASTIGAVEETQGAAKVAKEAKGEFVRGASAFRRTVAKEDVVPGRYHLFIANNCPWCHRTMLARAILGLEAVVTVDVLFYRRHPDRGWQCLPPDEDLKPHERSQRTTLLSTVAKQNSVTGGRFVRELYEAEGSTEKSVPILFDKVENRIVNNESAEIIRIFNTAFRHMSHRPVTVPDLYPVALRPQIDQWNAMIYPNINNGAYKAGFSSSAEAYRMAFRLYFECIASLNDTLEHRRFLTGDTLTEADLRLLPTVVRHDPVYFVRMRLNKAMIKDYPFLNRWLTDMMQQPGVAEATNLEHCIQGYFGRSGNEIIPVPLAQWY